MLGPPDSSRDGGITWGRTQTVECHTCGLIGQTPPQDVLRLAIDHFKRVHPDVKVITDDLWQAYESPPRCDTCNAIAELPYWSHRSDPPTDVGNTIDVDGLWLVCGGCHDAWSARNLAGWVRRYMSVANDQMPKMINDPEAQTLVRAEIARGYRLLFDRFDAGYRHTSNPIHPRDRL
jgi:hypothetical protein